MTSNQQKVLLPDLINAGLGDFYTKFELNYETHHLTTHGEPRGTIASLNPVTLSWIYAKPK